MDLPDSVWQLFDPGRAQMLRAWQMPAPEELRFRIGQTCSALTGGVSYESARDPVTAVELDHILARATKASLYAHEEELCRGYLHMSSGVRLGVCGMVYSREGSVAGIRSVTSVSVRIPREIPNCADRVIDEVTKNGFRSTLIVSPPGFGKTTLLRAMIQRLSAAGYRVSVADERGEIAAVSGRAFGFDLGPCTDVLSGGSKSESAMMLLRAMNPQILAFDEITAPNDIEMITRASGCGVSLLATAHGADLASMKKRSLYRQLFDTGIFEFAVLIYQRDGKRVYVAEPF